MQQSNASRRRDIKDIFLILIGAILQGISYRLFLIPASLPGGGVSGLAQIINHFNDWPIGLMVMIGNIPLFILGWRYLGGKRFAFRTMLAVVIFSLVTDFSAQYLPPEGLTDDFMLNALYGGVLNGIGFALVYRGRGTSGGTDILGRIISHYRAVPISQVYLLTDSVSMLLAGIFFTWEHALYAVIMLYVSGIAAETISEGARVVRTAMIITSQQDLVGQQIMEHLGRGVTRLTGEGMYTGQQRDVLYCVISRAEVERLKTIVVEADPQAFMVIGHAYEALGEGFQAIRG